MAKAEKQARPVVVTTSHLGVFVGRTTDADDAEHVTLTGARMVVYWDDSCHGVLGIAKRGVSKESRLSPAVDRITLRGITSVIAATDEAEKTWDAEPWK
jgi:hypothetical protein